jgi:hypothetical protein
MAEPFTLDELRETHTRAFWRWARALADWSPGDADLPREHRAEVVAKQPHRRGPDGRLVHGTGRTW